MNNKFLIDTLEGLTAPNKYLKSCYMYDATGDNLFQEIMKLDGYYLTHCEYEIFEKYNDEMMTIFSDSTEKFNLVELGAGDGHKTKIILKNYEKSHKKTTYIPIDISENILTLLKNDLAILHPDLQIKPIVGDYISALKMLMNSEEKCKNVVMFIGSTIGNFLPSETEIFLQELTSCLDSGDMMLIGFDLKKSPSVIKKAYPSNIFSESLVKNILVRINNELQGNFELECFEYFFFYNPVNGLGESSLISKKNQTVNLLASNTEISFKAWEKISVCYHQKYEEADIEIFAEKSGFTVVRNFYDVNKYFCNSIWKLK
ncbi:Methyltransf_33 domain-containing protein [Gammaproteobacteria bacterium]